MENITLKRISELLDLSISTVSRALKDHPDISAETKRRVTELADTLDYEPNINAINLRSRKNRVLALIVPSVSVFFFDSFISAVEEECRANDYTLIILQSGNDVQIEKNNLRICRQNRISGLFVCLASETTDMKDFDKFEEADIPLIFFDRVPTGKKYNKICIDDEDASKKAAAFLLKRNKKRLLCLFGDNRLSITKKRLPAFQHIKDHQKNLAIYFEHCHTSDQAKQISAQYFSKEQIPDAVFCMSDEILIGLMKCLNEKGIQIPAQTAVIALSDGFLPGLFTPEITYVETSGYKLGKLAFMRMLNCINGMKESEEMFTESALIMGASC